MPNEAQSIYFVISKYNCILFKLNFDQNIVLYNVVLVSTVQQSESVIRIHISPLFWISFPFRSPQSTEQSFLCYTMFSLAIYFIHSMNGVHVSIPVPNSSHPAFTLGYPHICSLCLCLYFCFANKITYTIFLDFTYMC